MTMPKIKLRDELASYVHVLFWSRTPGKNVDKRTGKKVGKKEKVAPKDWNFWLLETINNVGYELSTMIGMQCTVKLKLDSALKSIVKTLKCYDKECLDLADFVATVEFAEGLSVTAGSLVEVTCTSPYGESMKSAVVVVP